MFCREADRSLRGLTHQMPRAAAQTVLAIEQIDDPRHDPLDGHCADGCPCLLTDE